MDDGGGMRLAGYASVFDVADKGRDVVRRGAFAQAVAESAENAELPLLWQHETGTPIGRVERLVEDERGLRVFARLATGARTASDAAALVSAGALTGLSIGYRVRRSREDRAMRVRELLDLELVEVSLVTFPMQPLARVVGFTTGTESMNA